MNLPQGIAGGYAAAIEALIAGLTPPVRMPLSQWAAENREVSAESGSPHPGRWSNDIAPYLVEIQDCLSLHHPSRSVTFIKSAQVAGTEAGINLFGQVVDQTPAPMLIVLPNLEEAAKYVRLKLQPTIDATPCLRAKVKDQKSRDADGSTIAFKRFSGGFCQVTGANSSSGLQMVSARVLVCEEISEWPLEVGGRGDPLAQAETRQTAFDDYAKTFYCSTPKIKGQCRVTAKYEASDQRRYYLPCPHCGDYFVLRWAQMKWKSDFAPHGAYVSPPCCGVDIEHWQKRAMVAGGVWLKTYKGVADAAGKGDDAPGDVVAAEDIARHRERPALGRQPGFAIWQGYSNLVGWDTTVGKYLEAKGLPDKEQTFTQQVLGEAYEMKGDAPDHAILLARREDWQPGTVPPGVLMITGAADVGKAYIQYEVVGWGVGKTTWSIEHGVLEGQTSLDAVWNKLAEVCEKTWLDAQGRPWPIDMMAVDAGYETQRVYDFVRRRPNCMAVDGQPGALRPVLGTPKKQDVTFGGKMIRAGVMLWPVGAWQLKGELYANLAKKGVLEGAPVFPPGYCHFDKTWDEELFRQLTAEALVPVVNKRTGQTELVWRKSQANEALDIRVYNRAAAEHLGISRLTREGWARLAEKRNAPLEGHQMDLAAYWAGVPGSAPRPADGTPDPRPTAEAGNSAAAAAKPAVPAPRGAGTVRVRGGGKVFVRGSVH